MSARLKRRQFITLLGSAVAAWPLAARAQQDRRVRWIGALTVYTDSEKPGLESATAFEEGLAALGWNVGRNVAIDYRWAVTDIEKGRSAVGQVLRLSPDLILVNGGPALTARASRPRIYRKFGPPWRQHDRLRQYGIDRRREVVGTVQRDRSGCGARKSRFKYGLIICENIV
jgi:hypothetical protein